jgi:hypothetical protein
MWRPRPVRKNSTFTLHMKLAAFTMGRSLFGKMRWRHVRPAIMGCGGGAAPNTSAASCPYYFPALMSSAEAVTDRQVSECPPNRMSKVAGVLARRCADKWAGRLVAFHCTRYVGNLMVISSFLSTSQESSLCHPVCRHLGAVHTNIPVRVALRRG